MASSFLRFIAAMLIEIDREARRRGNPSPPPVAVFDYGASVFSSYSYSTKSDRLQCKASQSRTSVSSFRVSTSSFRYNFRTEARLTLANSIHPTPAELLLELEENFLSLQSALLLMDALLTYDQDRPLLAFCGPGAYQEGLEWVEGYTGQHAQELSFCGGAAPHPSRRSMTWAALTPEAPAWASPRVTPAPSPMAKKLGKQVSSSLDSSSREE